MRDWRMFQWPAQSERVLLKALAKMPQLRELTVEMLDNMSAMWDLLAVAPSIEFLSLTCRHCRPPESLPNKVNRTLQRLKAQSVQCGNVILSNNDVLDLFGLLPNLFHLTLAAVGPLDVATQKDLPHPSGSGSAPLATVRKATPPRGPVGANLRVLEIKTVADYDTLVTHIPYQCEVMYCDDRNKPWPIVLIEQSASFAVVRSDLQL